MFQVKLTATNDFGSDSELKEDYITVYGAPIPDFAVDSAMIPTGYAVNFTDMTYGNPISWQWTFEGGTPSTSTEQNPQGIVYNTPGAYSVTLAVISPYGTGDTTKADFITVVAPPESNFSCFNRYIIVGSTTIFTDQSTGDPATWEWNFEGGTPSTSNEKVPGPIQYNAPGAFDVSLTVGNQWGSTTLNKPEYIHAGYPPASNFSADQTVIVEGESINFTDLSTEDPITWNWVFEGGTPGTSAIKNPSGIFYYNHGSYDVTLTVFNLFGDNTKTETDYIYVGGVGIGDQSDASEEVLVYPNPTTGILNVVFTESTPDIKSMELFNSIGIRVYMLDKPGIFEKKTKLDISGQHPGIYYLRVKTSEQVIIRKISLTR